MTDPDFIYDPNCWEVTHDYEDRDILVDDADLDVGDYIEFATLIKGPPKFAAKVVLTRDDGDPDETQIQWFDTEAEARAACGMTPCVTAG
jgi:hypothetical protein